MALFVRGVIVALVALSVGLVACQPAPSAKPPPASPVEKPPAAPAVKPPEKPAAKPEAKPADAWQQIVAAAKREGKVAVYGPSGENTRTAVTEGFVKRYPEIELEYVSGPGAQLTAKIVTERQAGLFVGDVFAGASGSILNALAPVDALEPLRPYLVGPDLNPSDWLGGEWFFTNAAQGNLAFVASVQPAFAYNPERFNPEQIGSYWELADAKWKGQIALHDPRGTGPGNGFVRQVYMNPSLGREFLQRLFANDITVIADERQHADWIIRGQSLIGVGVSASEFNDMKQKGLPIAVVSSAEMKEGGGLTSSTGSVSVMRNAPHPNAAKVYVNWLLSPEGQTEYSRTVLLPSRHLRVPTDHLAPGSYPERGKTYVPLDGEDRVALLPEIFAFVEKELGAR